MTADETIRRLSAQGSLAADVAPEPACCSEPECRRHYPISLYVGDFSDRAYAVLGRRVVSDRGDGTATFAATERHDITVQLREFIRRNQDWTRAVLDEETR